MPEMRFRVRWPDASETLCYSPSLVIREYFVPGESYRVSDFVARSQEALTIASDRVLAKYGYECSSAKAQLAEIEHLAQRFGQDTRVTILSFQP
jgi:uncharacterized repeat protein (TIGR04042 family)